MKIIMKISDKIFRLIFRVKSTDSEKVKELKNEMFPNTYCLIGLAYTVIYLILDMLIYSKKAMAFIALGCCVAILLTMHICISKVRNLIENNHPNLDRTKKNLQTVSAFSGWVAPIIFVVSTIVNFMP